MERRCLLQTAAGALLAPASLPNIVVILLATPQIDRLARQGIRFTDAHSGSAVCSPTRYGILTGRYA